LQVPDWPAKLLARLQAVVAAHLEGHDARVECLHVRALGDDLVVVDVGATAPDLVRRITSMSAFHCCDRYSPSTVGAARLATREIEP
jgi:hypothetical protein